MQQGCDEMKCEYCDSEISGGTDACCPCCGAPLPMPKVELANAEQTEEPPKDLYTQAERIAAQAKSVQTGRCRELIRQIRANAAKSGGLLASFASDVDRGDFFSGGREIICSTLNNVMLYETRAISRSHTVKSGYNGYNYEGRSERRTDYEFQKVTDGSLSLTDKRLVFSGGQQVRNINLDDIVTFTSDWLEGGELKISSSKRTKTMIFRGTTFDFSLRFNILRNQTLRQLVESGSEDETVSKFVELGILFDPMISVRSIIQAAKAQFNCNDIVMPDDKRFAKKWRNIADVIREEWSNWSLQVQLADSIAIIDCTLFGSAKNGALIDRTGIYMLNPDYLKAEFDYFVDWPTFRKCGNICKHKDVVEIISSPTGKGGLSVACASMNSNQAIELFKCIHKAIV